jgi:hypothetical protein
MLSNKLHNEADFLYLSKESGEDLMILALRTLQKYFQYSSFRGKQSEAIFAALSGKDAFVLMPTGEIFCPKPTYHHLPQVFAKRKQNVCDVQTAV